MPDFSDLPLVLTPYEIAKILRCGKSTAYELLRENKIAHFRVGHRILIPRASLLALLESTDGGQHSAVTKSEEAT